MQTMKCRAGMISQQKYSLFPIFLLVFSISGIDFYLVSSLCPLSTYPNWKFSFFIGLNFILNSTGD